MSKFRRKVKKRKEGTENIEGMHTHYMIVKVKSINNDLVMKRTWERKLNKVGKISERNRGSGTGKKSQRGSKKKRLSCLPAHMTTSLPPF